MGYDVHILIYVESREQVEENLETWRYALESIKVSRAKTEYIYELWGDGCNSEAAEEQRL